MPRVLRDHHRSRRRELLQPCGEIWGSPNHGLFQGRPFADQIADHNEASSDADTGRKGDTWRALQIAHYFNNGERGAHGALRLILVRARPAEIDEHAIAHEASDVTLPARNLARHSVLVGREDVSHFFGIEPL